MEPGPMRFFPLLPQGEGAPKGRMRGAPNAVGTLNTVPRTIPPLIRPSATFSLWEKGIGESDSILARSARELRFGGLWRHSPGRDQ